MGKVISFLRFALGKWFAPLWIVFLGDLYWIWMAIQIGSFWMVVIALIPPGFLIAGPIGAWSFLFGQPDWVLKLFG